MVGGWGWLDLVPEEPPYRMSFDPGCALASPPPLVAQGTMVEEPTGPGLGSHWAGGPCGGSPVYALGGGESSVHLPVRCCQPCFIQEVIRVGEGHKECQGHKPRPADVTGRFRGVQQTQESNFGHGKAGGSESKGVADGRS